ncbi:MAG: SDR family NAD(P)-dependent oxidoreductase, partial [Nocardioides sp.]
MTDDKTILVVGGTSGLGREVAKRYADAGWSVLITGRDAAR